jgi:hypothetical protein
MEFSLSTEKTLILETPVLALRGGQPILNVPRAEDAVSVSLF